MKAEIQSPEEHIHDGTAPQILGLRLKLPDVGYALFQEGGVLVAVQCCDALLDVLVEFFTMGEAFGDAVVEDVLEDFSEPVVGFVVVFAVAFDPYFAHRPPLL